MSNRTRSLSLLALPLVLVACGDATPASGNPGVDATTDTPAVDKVTPADQTSPGDVQPDSPSVDQLPPDLGVSDVTENDTGSDGAADATAPDITPEDVIDVVKPEDVAPDVPAPDVLVPDVTAPDVIDAAVMDAAAEDAFDASEPDVPTFDVVEATASEDVTPDVPAPDVFVAPDVEDVPVDVSVSPVSCAAILRANPMATSGTYRITPPGGAETMVTCDFSTGRGYTFSTGRPAGASASMILGACPAGFAPFEVRSEAHAAALRRFVISPTPADRWYWANFFSGPASTCPTLANRTGWLRTMSEWVDATIRAEALAPLDLVENCHNVGAFDPVPINDRVGFSNRGCAGCRVLYNSTEQDLPGTVVCSVNDVLACGAGLDDCDGDASNGCETRTTDAAHCGACNRRCGAGEVCAAGACVVRSAGTFLPPPPMVPGAAPAVMATGISGPQGLVIAPDGRVYVSVTGSGSIVRIDPAATPPAVATFATGLSEPSQLAMNTGDALVVAERSANRVTRIAINADGTAGARTMLAAGFSGPWGVTWDGAGNLLVSNEYGNTVDRVAPDGTVTRGVISGYNAPLDMRFDAAGRLWVGQYFGTALNNGTLVHQYDASLTRLRTVTGFSGPIGIALDAAGNAYVANWDGGATSMGRILRVATDGAVTMFASGLSGPHAIAFDARGGLWVADYASNRVLRVGGR
jgi:sugar lactone lactonase YvrE